MKTFKPFGQFVLLCLLTFQIMAQANEQLSEQELNQLSHSRTWLNLLHYEEDSSSPSGFTSAIHNPAFFISNSGKTEPQQELIATIDAFTGDSSQAQLKQYHCQFPARLLWLRTQLGNDFAKEKILNGCEEYREWTRQGSINSISIVYATGYLGNPASFYGHTLLKFNSSEENKNTHLLDSSLNYGAIVPDNENPVVYILKGLFGGYDAGFTQIEFYFHEGNYGEGELRDMWEYELNLSQNEVDLLVAHSWEVLRKEYTYYFLKENCAYRMAELFSIIDGLDVVPDGQFWTYPQDVVQLLPSLERNGEKIVKDIYKYPSRQTRLYNKYSQLSFDEKKHVEAAIDSTSYLNSTNFESLSTQGKHRVLDTLLDYYQIIEDSEEEQANKAYQAVLSARFKVEKGQSNFEKKYNKQSGPHSGRKPSLISLGTVNHEAWGQYETIRLRPAYYDSLDASSAHIGFSQLSMGELGLIHHDGSYALDYLDVINIQSINSKATGLPQDGGSPWNLRVGWERDTFSCIDCSLFKIQGDMGYSIAISEDFVIAGYFGGGLQESGSVFDNYFVRAKAFSQVNFSSALRGRVTYEHRADFESNSEESIEVNLRLELAKNWESRFLYRKSDQEEIGISVGYYW
ncbi:DUF4105 domain-containing protein [Kangiella sp.]|uniref:Lnb N-terminal periplasmic domain-containing protein n=1 Tax=Kangiella sp. TaxID=1920245 RepID=UPI0019B188CA|nr:DUF4105 domain-containing protein [Kangiella sp.]MBD3652349.1 DUF4105 domain-containing protein [Kangiella sp.]